MLRRRYDPLNLGQDQLNLQKGETFVGGPRFLEAQR